MNPTNSDQDNKVTCQDLKQGAMAALRGRISYSHIYTPVDGEERDRDNEKRRFKIDKPYYQIKLSNVTVIGAQDNAGQPMINPAQTNVGRYVHDRLFTLNDYPDDGFNYNAIDTSKNPPRTGWRDNADSKNFQWFELEGELKRGLDVTLILRVFVSKNFSSNPGLAIDSIIINGKPEYYRNETRSGAETLLGLTPNGPWPARPYGGAPAAQSVWDDPADTAPGQPADRAMNQPNGQAGQGRFPTGQPNTFTGQPARPAAGQQPNQGGFATPPNNQPATDPQNGFTNQPAAPQGGFTGQPAQPAAGQQPNQNGFATPPNSQPTTPTWTNDPWQNQEPEF